MAHLMARVNTTTNEVIEYRILSDPHPEVSNLRTETWACIASYTKADFSTGVTKLQPLLELLEKVTPKKIVRGIELPRTVIAPNRHYML